MLNIVEFKTEYRAGKDPVDWVLLAPLGAAFEKQRSWHRVSKLVPPEVTDEAEKKSQRYVDILAKWSIIGPAYEAWKDGNELPSEGTPLEAWSGLTRDQVEFLHKHMGIKTVEEIRDMGDATISKLPFPHARKMPDLAKRWLEGEALSEKDAKITDMEEQLAVMREMLEERMKEEKPRRGPGRPRKQETEAA